MNTVKKVFVGVGVVVVALCVATPVFAAQPATKACFGHDISGYATSGETDPGSFFAFGPKGGWGGFISGVAQSPGADGHVGVGGEINAHHAGFVPDAVIANSCND